MSKLLVIKANPNPIEKSYGLSVGQSFIDSYKEHNPTDTIDEINVFDMDIPEIDGTILTAWDALAHQGDLSKLQKEALGKTGAILENFLKYDKYVFITPLWNSCFPSRLKSYLDALCVPGKTFKYTDLGPQGLITGKKALHIHTSGSFIRSANLADSLLREILNLIGVKEVETLYVQGHANMPHLADSIKERAKDIATQTAKGF